MKKCIIAVLTASFFLWIPIYAQQKMEITRPHLAETELPHEIYKGIKLTFQNEKGSVMSMFVSQLYDEKVIISPKGPLQSIETGTFIFYQNHRTDTITLSLNHSKPSPIVSHKIGDYYFVWELNAAKKSEVSLCAKLDTLQQAKIILKELNNLDPNNVILFEVPVKGNKGCALPPGITIPINKGKEDLSSLNYDAVWDIKTKTYKLRKKS